MTTELSRFLPAGFDRKRPVVVGARLFVLRHEFMTRYCTHGLQHGIVQPWLADEFRRLRHLLADQLDHGIAFRTPVLRCRQTGTHGGTQQARQQLLK